MAVKCPKCGSQFYLHQQQSYEINEDGSGYLSEPFFQELTLRCSICGYEPQFDININGEVVLQQDK